MPGVTATTVDAALLVSSAAAATSGQHFAQLVNACGGVHGRRLVLHTVVATGDATADCAALVATGAVVVVTTNPVAPDACVRANPGLVVVAPDASATNAVLAGTHGRLFVGDSPEGPTDARVADLVQHAGLASSRFAVIGTNEALRRALAVQGLQPALVVDAGATDTVQQLRRAHVDAVLTDHFDPDLARGALMTTLMEKVRDDPYPSSTMLDLIEQMLTEEEIPAYVLFLQEKIAADRFPSMSMIKRLTDLVS